MFAVSKFYRIVKKACQNITFLLRKIKIFRIFTLVTVQYSAEQNTLNQFFLERETITFSCITTARKNYRMGFLMSIFCPSAVRYTYKIFI